MQPKRPPWKHDLAGHIESSCKMHSCNIYTLLAEEDGNRADRIDLLSPERPVDQGRNRVTEGVVAKLICLLSSFVTLTPA